MPSELAPVLMARPQKQQARKRWPNLATNWRRLSLPTPEWPLEAQKQQLRAAVEKMRARLERSDLVSASKLEAMIEDAGAEMSAYGRLQSRIIELPPERGAAVRRHISI